MRKLTLLLLLLASFVGCRSNDPSTDAPKDDAALSDADLERLQALGYEPWVEEPEIPEDTGVSRLDARRSEPGFVLFANRGGCSAVLMDKNGKVHQSWQGEVAGFWSDTELLDDGSLLVVGAKSNDTNRQPVDRYLRKLAWDSTVVWETKFPAHHDVETLADGRILTLSSKVREISTNEGPLPIIDDLVVITSPTGVVQEEYSLFDLFQASKGLVDLAVFRHMITVGGRKAADIFHANSVHRISSQGNPDHPIYKPGNILVSMRHQNLLVIFDPTRRELVWAWGRGTLDGQHSARFLPNGNVTVFDNGLRRKRSRVLEVDPRTNEIAWEFAGPEPTDFYTPGGGAAQRLPNGNTLVTETRQGRLFEVAPDGEIVWMFVNPRTDPQEPRRATIHASTWLPSLKVLPILESNQS